MAAPRAVPCGTFPAARMLTLDSPLTDLSGAGPARAKQMARIGVETIGDLLLHFPRRHEDRREFPRFPAEPSDEPVCVCGIVSKSNLKRMGGGRSMVEVTLREESVDVFSRELTARWFNLPWMQRNFLVDSRAVLFGKPKSHGGRIVLDHPESEILRDDEESTIHTRRLAPIHGATEGLTPRVIRAMVWRAFAAVPMAAVPTLVPAALDPAQLSRWQALRDYHFPTSGEALHNARRHLVLEEFLGLQLIVAARRRERSARGGPARASHAGALAGRFLASLPFQPTGAQTRALEEIRNDLRSPRPMNRLLQGDVGSGKTLVALAAMLERAEGGAQAALMAPTQILAEQHYLAFQRWLAPLGLRIALRTGSARASEGGEWFGAEKDAEPDLVVGTHALLYDGARKFLPRLGLVVVDEQHKFGVRQRARLSDANGAPPDVLVMTATPIPRTLAISVYGDLDLSVLDELPAGRGKIITAVRPASKRAEAAKFFAEHLAAGRQAFLVHPLIDESEKLDARAAAASFEAWSAMLAPHPCALLHGRMDSAEKESVMSRFRAGEISALICTTVIEVGVDVPNASLMLVENAERFGLAQLHQLRGRVGRGAHKSYCILLTEDREAVERLRILEQTTDGFEIAEEDLRRRGPGDLVGSAQSGLPNLRLGDLIEDAALMRQARAAAAAMIEADPELRRPAHAPWKSWLEARQSAAVTEA